MKIFEIEFSLDEVSQIVNTLSDRLNRDKNALCLLVHFSNEFVKDWYNDINIKFTPLVLKGGFGDLGETDKRNLLVLITESTYIPVANTFKRHFKKVIDRPGEFSRIINDESDINKLSKLMDYIQKFEDFAIHKNEWYRRSISWDADIGSYRQWQYDLWNITIEANDVKLELGDSFNCSYSNMKNFVRDYKRGT